MTSNLQQHKFSNDLVKSILVHLLLVLSMFVMNKLGDLVGSQLAARVNGLPGMHSTFATKPNGSYIVEQISSSEIRPVQASLISKQMVDAAIKRQDLLEQEQASKLKNIRQQEQQLLQFKKDAAQEAARLKQALEKSKQETELAKQEREQMKKQQLQLQQTAAKLQQQSKELQAQQDKIAKEKLQLSKQELKKKKS